MSYYSEFSFYDLTIEYVKIDYLDYPCVKFSVTSRMQDGTEKQQTIRCSMNEVYRAVADYAAMKRSGRRDFMVIFEGIKDGEQRFRSNSASVIIDVNLDESCSITVDYKAYSLPCTCQQIQLLIDQLRAMIERSIVC